jgi:hypothetical protein
MTIANAWQFPTIVTLLGGFGLSGGGILGLWVDCVVAVLALGVNSDDTTTRFVSMRSAMFAEKGLNESR